MRVSDQQQPPPGVQHAPALMRGFSAVVSGAVVAIAAAGAAGAQHKSMAKHAVCLRPVVKVKV